ncbi:MAG: hypothetical protein PHR66_06890 [Desulfuromonadaceae bacterium]|nr:hypothetical protein [Desulfuromonadaceae bacterium]
MNIATAGELYNRQLHKEEVKFLQNNIEKFKEYIANKYSIVQGAIISANAEELLTQGAEYLVDENMKNSIDNNTTSRAFPKEQLLQNIKEFLEIQSQGLYFTDTYKESMTPQGYFTTTDEQYKDSNWKPDSSIRLEDNSLMFLPSTKVAQTLGTATKEVSPIIIQKTGQVYDDVTLGITNKMLNITPKTEQIIDITSDVINSYLPGVPSNNFIGLGTSVFGTFYGYEKMGNDIGDILKELKNEINNFKFENANEK